MRKAVILLLLVVWCIGLTGCFSFNREHNRDIVRMWKRDLQLMHEDLDFILFMHPSQQEPPDIWGR